MLMSMDRFNHNVDRKVKTKAAPVQRVEVITGVERRRDWPDEKKLAIVAESCQDGVVISDVAPAARLAAAAAVRVAKRVPQARGCRRRLCRRNGQASRR